MASGSGIAFWEVLIAHHPCLDGPPICLDSLKHPALVFSCCLFLVLIPIYFSTFSRAGSLKEDHIHTRVALQALVTVLVPTCSLWPSRYIELASALRFHIDIPLEVIIKDTINGVIELRDPSNDLIDLIGSGRTVNRHIICISIEWKWWIRYLKWWMLAKSHSGHFSLPSKGYMLELPGWLHHSMPTANSTSLDQSPRPFTSALTLFPLLCLDCLPRGTVPSLYPDCKTTLEFTAFSPSLRVFSMAQIISTIPFMMSARPRRRPRPLVSVLKQLSASHGPNMVIESLSNVSVDYEHALCRVYKSLSGEQKIRETWVKVLGIKAWRREMFLVALEAALVRRGWIERWAVQVTTG